MPYTQQKSATFPTPFPLAKPNTTPKMQHYPLRQPLSLDYISSTARFSPILANFLKIFSEKVDKLKDFGYFCKVFCRLTNDMGKFSEYKLPLKSMPEGSQDFDYQIGKQFFVNMENNDVRNADVKVHLKVTHKNDYYDMLFTLAGEIIVACDRCLDDLTLPIDTEYHIIVKYGETYRDDSDEFMEIPFSDADINVSYMIHDTIALAIPIKHVHAAGNCNKAMSSILRKHRTEVDDDDFDENLINEIDDDNTPTDSRWDKLKGLNFD